MSRFAKSRSVLFVEEALEGEEPWMECRVTSEGVMVAVPRLPVGLAEDEQADIVQGLLANLLERLEIVDYVLWYLTPMALPFTRDLTPKAVVYDCMDELSGFAHAPGRLLQLETELLRRSDVVFTGGRSLYEAKRGRHDSVHLFPSSVDVEHFAAAREPSLPEPADQARLPRPRIGYFGVIDERLDLGLLAGLADARPDWQLVLVGPVAKIHAGELPQRSNIAYLGMKQYAELPAYLAGWDVAMLPFALNDATRFISPTKTPEYLAGGKPVVSTPVPDVVEPYGTHGFVEIASNVGEFVVSVERRLREGMNGNLASVDAFLASMSWDVTQARMAELVDGSVRPATRRSSPRRRFDYLVVGAGFAGSVLAERLTAKAGKRVLLVDRRSHIGGNAYDRYDDAGVLVHAYGPHIFHTNSPDVFAYLSNFTDWRPYEHRVRASVDGMLVPMPINLDTINTLYGTSLDSAGLEHYFASVAEPIERPTTSEEVVVGKVGRELYEKFFRNYTRKQWGLDPSELDASVTSRVPTRLNRDDRYFLDRFQAMPLHGYTRMFERMLDQPNLHVMLGTDLTEIEGHIAYDQLVFTGAVDEYFDYAYGGLPYRSINFEFVTHDLPVFQSAPVVNFPNEHLYTRCTEFKYLTGQVHHKSTVVYEYPTDTGAPYYPIPRPENAELYRKYKALAEGLPNVHFVGRLATYRYYNMDQVVAQALATFKRLEGADGPISGEPLGGRILNAA